MGRVDSCIVLEDEIYEAEIFQSSSDNVLNITLGATAAVSIIFLILGASVGHVLTEPAPDSNLSKNGGLLHYMTVMQWI